MGPKDYPIEGRIARGRRPALLNRAHHLRSLDLAPAHDDEP